MDSIWDAKGGALQSDDTTNPKEVAVTFDWSIKYPRPTSNIFAVSCFKNKMWQKSHPKEGYFSCKPYFLFLPIDSQ